MAQAAAQRVGYANGGDTAPPAAPSTPPADDLNHRAALLAGLRKRYDAMIAMAQGAHAHGDIKTAAHLASKAHDMVPDGKNLTHNVTPDGHILSVVHGKGGVESTHPMTSQQFHHYLVGPATSFDHVIDNGVGHNLHIASGRQQPRVQEHPNDPIHRVRQVLQHTRQMHGLHRIGQQQAPAPTGYAAGGPVRGYDDGGTVDDDQTIDPTLLSSGTPAPTEDDYGVSDYVQQQRAQQAAQAAADQERQSAQRASDVGSDDPLMQGLTQRYRPVNRPADRTTGFAADPDAPITSDSSMGALLKKAAEEKWARNQANAPESASIPGAISSAWGSIKQKLADYINGTNAAPPHEVDAAMAATQAANPTASTAEVVQKTIAGTADPLSPNYMDQAGQDALGGLGGSSQAGRRAPTTIGYAQPPVGTYTGSQGEQRTGPNTLTVPPTARPSAQLQRAVPPLSKEELMEGGLIDSRTADRILNAGDPKDPFTQALNQHLPKGMLDDPAVRKDLQNVLRELQPDINGIDFGPLSNMRRGETAQIIPNMSAGNNFSTSRDNLVRVADKLINKANNRIDPQEPSTGLASTTDQETGRVTYPNTAVGRASQAADQARARGENPISYTPPNMAIGHPLYDVDDIQRGTPLNMPQPSSRSTPARAAPRTYIGPQGEERTGPNRAVGRRSDAGDDTGAPGPQYAMADTGTMSDASDDIRSNAGQVAQTGAAVQPKEQQATGYARSTYTGSQGEERTGPNTLVAQGTPVNDPVMQERLADLQQRIQAQTGLSNTEAARMAYDTAERDPSQLTPRYENPPARPRQSTGYANQAPAPGGFSGSAGNNVTTIPVRQGAPTPADAAPAVPATAPTYPQGYKLVSATPAQGTVSDYDRAVVGPDGKVVNYVRKGEAPPSSDVVMNKVYSDNINNNMQEFYRRLHAGEPTGIDLNQYKQGNYDLSQPLPPRQAPTAQSMADRDEAVRQNIIRPSSQMQQGGGGGDPVQDLLQRAAQTRDPNAQRMFTNEAYKIQETRRVNQQKSADAALKTFSTGEQNLIKSIYTKENGGNKLTPAEQALKDDYVTRIQQHSQQGAATTPSATSSATTKTINGVTYRWDGKGWLRQ